MLRQPSTSRAVLARCTCNPSQARAISSSSTQRGSGPNSVRALFGLADSSPSAESWPAPRLSSPLSSSSSPAARDAAKKAKELSMWERYMKPTLKARPEDVDPGMARWNRATQKALESTLRERFPAAGSGTGLGMRCTTFNHKGDVTQTMGTFGKTEICQRYGIQPRDLRKLDSAVPTIVPTILVRRACIILTMLHLRVVITANEVTLVDSVGSEDSWLKGVFVWHLGHALKTAQRKAAHELPYEFRALESCLVSVTTALETEFTNLKALVVELLDGLEDHINRDKLRLLLQYSRKLSAFQKRAQLTQECITELLENDGDLAAMYLTDKDKLPQRDAADHEEIELLLESISKQIEEVVSESENLSANVRHTEDIIELILDANRNSLLGLDLKVSIATLGLTSGALVAGLFGMNLTSKLEEYEFAFPLVSAAAFGLAGGVTLIMLKRLRQMRRLGLGRREVVGGEGMRDRMQMWQERRARKRAV